MMILPEWRVSSYQSVVPKLQSFNSIFTFSNSQNFHIFKFEQFSILQVSHFQILTCSHFYNVTFWHITSSHYHIEIEREKKTEKGEKKREREHFLFLNTFILKTLNFEHFSFPTLLNTFHLENFQIRLILII